MTKAKAITLIFTTQPIHSGKCLCHSLPNPCRSDCLFVRGVRGESESGERERKALDKKGKDRRRAGTGLELHSLKRISPARSAKALHDKSFIAPLRSCPPQASKERKDR